MTRSLFSYPRTPDTVQELMCGTGGVRCSGMSEDTLAWTSQWYLRQDMLREANARLVNAHHPHQLTQLWGGGTLSSSDGQRFPQCGRDLTTRALSRYFLDEGTTTYAQVSDQHSTYGTKVIPTTWREAVEALCLTLVTNATVLWTSASPRYVVDALRADGYHVTDEAAAHLTPAPHDHINFYGTYSFDVETELHREERRPLRSPAA
jgi:hypothetical protein